jgi:hypothetical protein
MSPGDDSYVRSAKGQFERAATNHRTEIAELLCPSAEVHCLDPASRLAIDASAAVADSRNLVESRLERCASSKLGPREK